MTFQHRTGPLYQRPVFGRSYTLGSKPVGTQIFSLSRACDMLIISFFTIILNKQLSTTVGQNVLRHITKKNIFFQSIPTKKWKLSPNKCPLPLPLFNVAQGNTRVKLLAFSQSKIDGGESWLTFSFLGEMYYGAKVRNRYIGDKHRFLQLKR